MSTLNKLVGEPTDNFNDLFLQEKKLEDEAVTTDFEYRGKLRTIYKEWAANLEEQHKLNFGYPDPLNTISSYIKARLRIRGVTEGAITYVSDSLEGKYKQDKFNKWRDESDVDDLSVSLPIQVSDGKTSLFLDTDATINEIRTLPDLYRITAESPTQATLLLIKKIDQLADLKKRISIQVKNITEFAKTYSLRLGPTPVRKEKPPEAFRGQTEMSEKLRETQLLFKVLSEQIGDVADQMDDFKPNPEVRQKVINYWEKFVSELNPIVKAMNFLLKCHEQLIRFNSDSKVAASEDYWFKVAFDNLDNANAHGSGVVNAIPTGQVLMEISKDREDVVIFNVVREFTREDVTDQTKALLKKAQMAAAKENVQKALNTWAYDVVHVEHIGDPYEFYERYVQREYLKENITREERDRLLAKPPRIFYEDKGRRVKEADIGRGKKYEVLDIEHSSYGNIARRRQYKSEPFSRKA